MTKGDEIISNALTAISKQLTKTETSSQRLLRVLLQTRSSVIAENPRDACVI